MGSNMQRQAVPLLKTESPIVGTGMEYKACLDSGVAVVSKNAGVVESVDADKIVVREDSGMLRTYELTSSSVQTQVLAQTRDLSSTRARELKLIR